MTSQTIDTHIALLESALDALKHSRYALDTKNFQTEHYAKQRSNEDSKAYEFENNEERVRELESENALLLKALKKVIEDRDCTPRQSDNEYDDGNEFECDDCESDNVFTHGSFSPGRMAGSIGMRKNFSEEFETIRTKTQKLVLTQNGKSNSGTNTMTAAKTSRDNNRAKSANGEETMSRRDMEVLERLLQKKRVEESEAYYSDEEEQETAVRKATKGMNIRTTTTTTTRPAKMSNQNQDDVPSTSSQSGKKVPFELLMCNDDGCELIAPKDRTIRVRQHGTPHTKFTWKAKPRNALIVKKPLDFKTDEMLPFVVKTLISLDLNVWMEPEEYQRQKTNAAIEHKDELKTWDANTTNIDFVVVLGGDGTFLWVSNLFPKACPPVVAFALGTLGFLTVFKESKIRETLKDVVDGDFCVSLRTRLIAHILDKNGEEKSKQSVLNEVVVDRGPSAILVELDVAVDGSPLTKVFADGIIVSTPTGSTAYGLAAGGSMVHPGVSAMCFTPVCPHSLSFRPLVLPDSVVLTVRVPEDARAAPWTAFDGKNHAELKRGETLVIRCAHFPIASVCRTSENMDWFRAMKDALLWNVRGHQRFS